MSLWKEFLARVFTLREIALMENAPWAVVKIALGLVILEGVGLWFLMSWHYGGLIAAKDAALKVTEERTQSLKERVEEYRERLHLIPANSRYEQMSISELVKAANNLATKLREEGQVNDRQYHQVIDPEHEEMRKASPQEREQIWSKMMTHMQELSERRQTKYEKEYKSDAILIREEMLSRIPQETREKMQVFHGSYAMGGFYERTAEDLEMLSRMLSK